MRRLSFSPVLALSLALAASFERPAEGQCVAPGPVVTLTDGGRWNWDIATNGQIASGTNGAFADGFALKVDAAFFPAAARSMELGGRQLVHGPVQMSGLSVTRRVFVPQMTPGVASGAFARFLEYFQNSTGRGIQVVVRLETNVGSHALTRVTGTSDGDAIYDPGDRWIGTSDGRGIPRPQVTFNYWGPSAVIRPSSVGLTVYDCMGREGTFAEFSLFVPAHATRILMHLGSQLIQDAPPSRAAGPIDNLVAPNMLDGLSRRDLLRIANWGFSSTRLFTFAAQTLYQVQTTGQGTTLATLPMITNAAAFSPDAVLYALINPGPQTHLATIDLDTGQETPIGATWPVTNVLAMEASSSGQLYAAGIDGALYRVDRATGAPTLFGNVGPLPIVDLAFEPTRDQLWALVLRNGVNSLYRIDIIARTATPVSTISGLPAGHFTTSLSIAQDGTFYLIDDAQIRQTSFLYRLDPATGRTVAVNMQFPLSMGIVSGDFFLHNPPICGNGIVEPGEQCDDGAANGTRSDCCSVRCTFQPAAVVCRPSAGICDVAENCTGQSADCPVDQFQPSSTVCHSSAGVCDLEQRCTGSSAACPSRQHRTDQCRPAARLCDAPAFCDGVDDDCPPNPQQPDGSPCSTGLVCNGTEACRGGACQSVTPLDCHTGNPCRRDSCVEPTGCVSTPIPGCCNTSMECSDQNACHRGICSGPGGTCRFEMIAGCCNRNPDCEDGDLCHVNTCSGPGGTCTHAPLSGCCRADGDCPRTGVCSRDTCNLATHRCVSTPIAGCCRSDRDCDDGNPCTTDACTLATGACTHTPIAGCCLLDGDCASHDVCIADTCPRPGAQCQHARIPSCCTQNSDCMAGGTCTMTSCNLMTNRCTTTPVTGCCTQDGDCVGTMFGYCDLATHMCAMRPQDAGVDAGMDASRLDALIRDAGAVPDAEANDLSRPDAETRADSEPRADAEPPADVEVRIDAEPPDMVDVDASVSEDSALPDAASRDAARPTDATPQQDDTKFRGCSCDVAERTSPQAGGAWAAAALLLGAIAIRRRRPRTRGSSLIVLLATATAASNVRVSS